MKPRNSALIFAIAGIGIIALRVAISCGPWIPTAQFGESRNWINRNDLLKGRLGIVRPEFARKSLFTAYRYLTNVPLSPLEIDALYPANSPDRYGLIDPIQTAADAWLQERKRVNGSAPLRSIYADSVLTPAGLAVFDNCLEDAFLTASATLDHRIALWGESNANTDEWVRGQDAVFANCSGGPAIPAALPAQVDSTLAADRRYQIAAAEFYAKRFTDALRDFAAIAQDPNSEWRNIAPYLEARTLLRRASLDNIPEALAEAKARLEAIVADPNEAPWHDSARGLLSLIQVRQDPDAYLIETAERLSHAGLGAEVVDVFNDFDRVWDHTRNIPTGHAGLVDWLRAEKDPSAAAHAMTRWRETRSPAWLIAALQHASKGGSDTPQLIEAAAAMRPGEAAYATATYLGIALETAHDRDAARQWADTALAARQQPAVDNEFRAERLALARNWNEFLRYAPRTPVAQELDVEDVPLDEPRPAKRLDADAAYALNQLAPLKRLVEAAHSAPLPRDIQLEVARAAWTRAGILGDAGAGRDLALRLSQLQPDVAPNLKRYLDADGPAAARFEAIYIMLRNPGLSPLVAVGFPRKERTSQIDPYRNNWWSASPDDRPQIPGQTVTARVGPISYLSAAEIAAGRAEFAKLQKLAAVAPNYLTSAAIDWARAHPADERNAEALALAVRSTRYGITDKVTPNWSRTAFLLLHRNYPSSPWTHRTKYWY